MPRSRCTTRVRCRHRHWKAGKGGRGEEQTQAARVPRTPRPPPPPPSPVLCTGGATPKRLYIPACSGSELRALALGRCATSRCRVPYIRPPRGGWQRSGGRRVGGKTPPMEHALTPLQRGLKGDMEGDGLGRGERRRRRRSRSGRGMRPKWLREVKCICLCVEWRSALLSVCPFACP